MTYLTADQWHTILMRHRKACQRIVARDGELPTAQWETLGRITFLAQATAIDAKARDRHGRMDDRPEWVKKLFPGNTPDDKLCPECLGEGIVFTGRRLTGRGMDAWHDAPEYEYMTCDVCGGTGLDSSDNDEVDPATAPGGTGSEEEDYG